MFNECFLIVLNFIYLVLLIISIFDNVETMVMMKNDSSLDLFVLALSVFYVDILIWTKRQKLDNRLEMIYVMSFW